MNIAIWLLCVAAAIFVVRKRSVSRQRADQERIRRLEAQLARAQKLQAIGQLVGGIVHDFNNFLMIIHGYSQLIETSANGGRNIGEAVQAIKSSVARCSNLSRQLLAFVGKQEDGPHILNISGNVTDLRKILGKVLPRDIELRFYAAPNLWPVKGDPSQIDQIVLNLVVNAADAMPNGGTITIETLNVTLERDSSPAHRPAGSGEYVVLSVSDTGIGMDKETATHIFEPLFTTKEAGRGTGLGLAVVHENVKRSGGEIFVDSHPSIGTSFRIYFPKAAGNEMKERSFAEESATAPGFPEAGNERVLLMEHDEKVRSLLATSLRNYGFEVIAPSTPVEARTISETSAKPVDALVTNFVLPTVSGPELAASLSARNPRAAIVYVADYVRQPADVDFETLGRSTVLTKPFSSATLAQRLRLSLALTPPEVRIGTRLIRLGHMSPEAIENVLQLQQSGDERRFGEIAVSSGYVSEQQISEAMSMPEEVVARQPRLLIGEYFISRGTLSPSQVSEIVRYQRQGTEGLFGRIAIVLGYLTEQELSSYIEEFRRNGLFGEQDDGSSNGRLILTCMSCGFRKVLEAAEVTGNVAAAVLTSIRTLDGTTYLRCPHADFNTGCSTLDVRVGIPTGS